MKVEIINPFITSTVKVLGEYVGGEMEQGQLAVRTMISTNQQVSVTVGISGDIRGEVIYGMSPVTATKIASIMMGMQHVAFDEMAVNAISELGNIISGSAVKLLTELGYTCEITTPTVVRGMNIEMAMQVPALVVPLYTRCGKIDINIALAEAATDIESAG